MMCQGVPCGPASLRHRQSFAMPNIDPRKSASAGLLRQHHGAALLAVSISAITLAVANLTSRTWCTRPTKRGRGLYWAWHTEAGTA